ncbi:MAG: transcription-repair coupling factor [Propionibacteriaceae bacterium]|nr:transcription-repair coupling factor [Propionibacteriaceae bacterium]
MSVHGLTSLIAQEPSIQCAVDAMTTQATGEVISVAHIRPFLVEMCSWQRPVLITTSTYREAETITTVMQSLLTPEAVAYYPAWETLPHERLSPRCETVGRRLEVLSRLGGDDSLPPPQVIVAPVRSLLQPQVAGLTNLPLLKLRTGEDHSINNLARVLVEAGYQRTDLVMRRGEFAIRGGIVDLFTPVAEQPVRIDFFGDTIEDIREFTVGNQRSTSSPQSEVTCVPCREIALTQHVRERAKELGGHHLGLSDMLERISQGQVVDGMEALAPVLTDGMELFTDVLDPSTVVLVWDPELVRSRATDLVETSQEFLRASWTAAASGGKAPIDVSEAAYQSFATVRSSALERGLSWWDLALYGAQPESGSYTIMVEPHGLSGGDATQGIAEVNQRIEHGETVVVVADSQGLGQRFVDLFSEAGTPAGLLAGSLVPPPGQVSIVTGNLREGFTLPMVNLAILTASDLTGADHNPAPRKLPTRRKKEIDPLSLTTGDMVVHDAHGVGRYLEMTTRTVLGIDREYLVIEYAPSKKGHPADRLYVPMDQLNLVTPYVGGEAPRLDRLGGADWENRKSRARKAVREIAAELVKLYAARQAIQGFAFSPDTQWQKEMEDSFSYIETADQLACIDDVKADMESITPMDRLVCGDVGYGKTEIAVRAAFKAVMDGKQVAILVPTTLLVRQHAATFTARFAGFPITVASLSRFETDAAQKKTLEAMSQGTVDVVIGTHRLLSADVHFRDLGLVVIDEEQRFGVDHKEALKKLRLDMDVLAMSATPIPRTLEMGITGIRELSVIQTPPEERHPVLTFAGVYDEGQVTAAIKRELAREGQVFFVHNRVSSINQVAARLAELVPEARIGVAHGKMSERGLEQVMEDYIAQRSDILVCTTIVESGLDISNANTLIVDRADMMGLSQLHQIRGRVGRGADRGYAYFFYPHDHQLSQIAHDRLATMAAHTDLGSGMKIAMRDLEIRGAGNLLGAEQSGHIAEVGFDLYLRLVGEAVSALRSRSTLDQVPEMRIEIPVDAHLPVTYIDSERLRLEMYRRIAAALTDDDLQEIVEELVDRYGDVPSEVHALIDVAKFRISACQSGITEVVAQGKFIRFTPAHPLADSRIARLNRMYPNSIIKPEGFILIPAPTSILHPRTPMKNEELLEWAQGVVDAIFAAS